MITPLKPSNYIERLFLFLIPCGLVGCSSTGTPPAAIVGRPGVYDYSPSVMQTGTLQQFWWCGRDFNPALRDQNTDTILYETIDLATQQRSGPRVVLAETPGAWDSEYTCNPHVIRGVFTNPLSDNKVYTYAMYYVGTEMGANNSIGVAFSNDGIAWNKYPSPVIPSTYTYGYGPAQPVAWNTDQKQAITLFYEDDDPSGPPNHHLQASSPDGVHFTLSGTLTTKGLDADNPLASWGDMAYDPASRFWYATYNLRYRTSATTGGIAEIGSVGFQLYRIAQDSLLTGKTGWQQLRTYDTNSLGYEDVFLAAMLQDGYGNLYGDPSTLIQLYPSFSDQTVPWNANARDVGNLADPSHWDIGGATWSPQEPAQLLLNRFDNGASSLVTTGWVDPAGNFKLGQALGHVYENPQNGATRALYACKNGPQDQFASLDPGCENHYIVGVNGYIFPASVAGMKLSAIYSCSAQRTHFVSKDAGCEGKTTDQLLGYLLP